MTVDLSPQEIREAIAAYLKTRGFLVRPDFEGHFRNRNTGNHAPSRVQFHTDCAWGSDLRGATVQVEVDEGQEIPGPYRKPG